MQDHKVSREIVDFTTYNNISVIRLEQLTNMRQTARTSRKNKKSTHLVHSIVSRNSSSTKRN
ncbi:hypothetical protein [Bacillus cereus]